MAEDKYDLIIEKLDSLEKGQKDLEKGQKDLEKGLIKNDLKLEQLGSDIKAVAEGHQIIRREMQEVKSELVSEFGLVKSALKTVAEKTNKIGSELSEVKQKTEQIDKKLDQHMLQPVHAGM